MKLKIKINIITAVIMGLTFCIMLYINSNIGFISDDWHFKFVFFDFLPADNDRRISSLEDIVLSMSNYYQISGGRVLPHLVMTLLLCCDKMIFNIINAAMFSILGFLVFTAADLKKYPHTLALVYISLFIFEPETGDTMVWLAGSVNYMWTSVSLLLAVLFIKNESNMLVTSLFVCLTSLSGEMAGGMIAVFTVVCLIVEKCLISRRKLLYTIIACAGNIFVVSAPGNYNRAEHIEKTKLFFSDMIPHVFSGWISVFFSELRIPLLIIFSAVCIGYITSKSKESAWCRVGSGSSEVNFHSEQNPLIGDLNWFSGMMPFIISGLSGMCALTLSGTVIKRALFFPALFVLIAAWRASVSVLVYIKILLNKKTKFYYKLIQALSYVFVIAFLCYNIGVYNHNCRIRSNFVQDFSFFADDEKAMAYNVTSNYKSNIFFPAEVINGRDYEMKWMYKYLENK